MRRRTIGLATAALGVGVIGVSIVASAGADDADVAAVTPSSTPTTSIDTSTTEPTSTVATTDSTTSSTTAATTVPAADSTTTSAVIPSTVVSSTVSPTTSAATAASPPGRAEVEAFFEGWAGQVATGDVDGLVATLHPLVIELYGRAQCESTLSDAAGRPVEVEVRSLTEPSSSTIALDGVALDVPGLAVVSVYRSDVDQVVDARVATSDGTINWFTDCGTPEAP